MTKRKKTFDPKALRKAAVIALVLAGILLALLMLCGCQHSLVTTGDYAGQGLTVTRQEATPAVIVVTRRDGLIESGSQILPLPNNPIVKVSVIPPKPAVSTYTITPETQAGDKYVGWRWFSWATKSPNMVASEIFSQRKGKETNPMPAVQMTDKGINIAAGGGSTSQDTGISWYVRLRNWIAQLWSWISMSIVWIGIFVILALFILPVILPASAPIIGAIVGGIKKAFLWVIPFVGGIVEWIRARFAKKSFQQTVSGIDVSKAKLYARTDLTPEQKDAIWTGMKDALMSEQDKKVQSAVDEIKKVPEGQ